MFGEDFEYVEVPFEIDPAIAVEQARHTVPDVYSAIVELVTNSDDSYKGLENSGIQTSGIIDVYVARQIGTQKCLLVAVRDEAAGMSCNLLRNKALKYGSGQKILIQTKVTPRGMFNRGLKEAILAMGTGRIHTCDGSQVSSATLHVDTNRGPIPKISKPIAPQVFDFRKHHFGDSNRGTVVIIEIENEKMVCPSIDKLSSNLQNHYALRRICASPERKVHLTVEDLPKGKSRSEPRFLSRRD